MTAFGIIADVDFESERVRWLGGFRFYLWGWIRITFIRAYPITIKIQLPKDGFTRNSYYHSPKNASKTHFKRTVLQDGGELIEDTSNIVFLVACNVTHLTEDGKTAPYAKYDDGLVDVVIVRECSRFRALRVLLGSDDGSYTNLPYVEYYQASRITMTPVQPQCNAINADAKFDVDGEAVAADGLDITPVKGRCFMLS